MKLFNFSFTLAFLFISFLAPLKSIAQDALDESHPRVQAYLKLNRVDMAEEVHFNELKNAFNSRETIQKIKNLFDSVFQDGITLSSEETVLIEKGGELTLNQGHLNFIQYTPKMRQILLDAYALRTNPKALQELLLSSDDGKEIYSNTGHLNYALTSLNDPNVDQEFKSKAQKDLSENIIPNSIRKYSSQWNAGPEEQMIGIKNNDWHGTYIGFWHTHPPRWNYNGWTGAAPSPQDIKSAKERGQFLTLSMNPSGFTVYDLSPYYGTDESEESKDLARKIIVTVPGWKNHFNQYRTRKYLGANIFLKRESSINGIGINSTRIQRAAMTPDIEGLIKTKDVLSAPRNNAEAACLSSGIAKLNDFLSIIENANRLKTHGISVINARLYVDSEGTLVRPGLTLPVGEVGYLNITLNNGVCTLPNLNQTADDIANTPPQKYTLRAEIAKSTNGGPWITQSKSIIQPIYDLNSQELPNPNQMIFSSWVNIDPTKGGYLNPANRTDSANFLKARIIGRTLHVILNYEACMFPLISDAKQWEVLSQSTLVLEPGKPVTFAARIGQNAFKIFIRFDPK